MNNSTLWFSIAFSLLLSYIGMFGTTVVYTAHMAHTKMPFSECPFSFSEPSLCARNMFEYLETLSWDTRTFFAGFVIAVVSFIVLTVVIAQRHTNRTQAYAPPLYQTLFSSGILHPKAP